MSALLRASQCTREAAHHLCQQHSYHITATAAAGATSRVYNGAANEGMQAAGPPVSMPLIHFIHFAFHLADTLFTSCLKDPARGGLSSR